MELYDDYIDYADTDEETLEHHGIKGMRWGIRRFQNKDGTLTKAGEKRYNKEMEKLEREKEILRNRQAVAAKVAKMESLKNTIDTESAQIGYKTKRVKKVENDARKAEEKEIHKQEKEIHKQEKEQKKEQKKAIKKELTKAEREQKRLEREAKKMEPHYNRSEKKMRKKLLESTDAKEIYENRHLLSVQELNDRITRIDVEARLKSKIVEEKQVTAVDWINDKLQNTKRTIDNANNLFTSADKAYSNFANSTAGKILENSLGITLPKGEKPKKDFDLDDFVKNINKKSASEIAEVNKRMANEKAIRKMKEELEKSANKTDDKSDSKTESKTDNKPEDRPNDKPEDRSDTSTQNDYEYLYKSQLNSKRFNNDDYTTVKNYNDVKTEYDYDYDTASVPKDNYDTSRDYSNSNYQSKTQWKQYDNDGNEYDSTNVYKREYRDAVNNDQSNSDYQKYFEWTNSDKPASSVDVLRGSNYARLMFDDKRFSHSEIEIKMETEMSDDELYHYGVKGMKWGVHRFYNADGTRTAAGKKRENAARRDNRKEHKAGLGDISNTGIFKNKLKSFKLKKSEYGGYEPLEVEIDIGNNKKVSVYTNVADKNDVPYKNIADRARKTDEFVKRYNDAEMREYLTKSYYEYSNEKMNKTSFKSQFELSSIQTNPDTNTFVATYYDNGCMNNHSFNIEGDMKTGKPRFNTMDG